MGLCPEAIAGKGKMLSVQSFVSGRRQTSKKYAMTPSKNAASRFNSAINKVVASPS